LFYIYPFFSTSKEILRTALVVLLAGGLIDYGEAITAEHRLVTDIILLEQGGGFRAHVQVDNCEHTDNWLAMPVSNGTGVASRAERALPDLSRGTIVYAYLRHPSSAAKAPPIDAIYVDCGADLSGDA
jgi:hypothetical protein